jgi:hypothetical protein
MITLERSKDTHDTHWVMSDMHNRDQHSSLWALDRWETEGGAPEGGKQSYRRRDTIDGPTIRSATRATTRLRNGSKGEPFRPEDRERTARDLL